MYAVTGWSLPGCRGQGPAQNGSDCCGQYAGLRTLASVALSNWKTPAPEPLSDTVHFASSPERKKRPLPLVRAGRGRFV